MKRTGLPRILITLGDVAGIGPEIVLRGWPQLTQFCVPTVVGDVTSLRRHAAHLALAREIYPVERPVTQETDATGIPCLQATDLDLRSVGLAQVHAAAGRAAFDFVRRAVQEVSAGRAEGIVTAPLHKEALARAGLKYPGHTEMLAELCQVTHYAMMLFARRTSGVTAPSNDFRDNPPDPAPGRLNGWGVVHVTLHLRLRDIFEHITTSAVVEKIALLGELLRRLLGREPRLAVCGLNPHASDGGLFGDEELRLIAPAVQQAQAYGWHVSGPWPADTLFGRAARGEVDGVVAMYHDQGHIPFKLLAGFHAVNVTLGLPMVRTSVAHGTAYDIAGRGCADATSLVEAVRVAALLVQSCAGDQEVSSADRHHAMPVSHA
ncbi:MAG: 4-hydroxythreonine-4-phosphate dehydrogenase PdxA [Gemmatales bacterium]|nr:4-hydroxythreonine-4-phosphate dehydrogenase PdxA [Gemmatales bacterium]MDW8221803.1 4-hydroxythreonine-4-phosphate dehydrogenase PdxA [Gemmatales bacterium]